MQIIFRRTLKPFGLLIQLLTTSKWEHVGIVDGDTVIHATALKGVCRESLASFKAKAYEWEIAEIDGDISIAAKRIGSGYDWTGLLGMKIPWLKFLNGGNRWSCSELVADCSPVFRRSTVYQIVPKHIYFVSKGVK